MIYIRGQVRCKPQGVSHIASKRHELWSTNGFKLEVSFHTSSVKSAFHFIARLRRRRSSNGTQPNYARQWMVNRANNVPQKSWRRPSEKWWRKTFAICSVYRRLRDLMANIYRMKRDRDNQAKGLESTKGLLRCLKIS